MLRSLAMPLVLKKPFKINYPHQPQYQSIYKNLHDVLFNNHKHKINSIRDICINNDVLNMPNLETILTSPPPLKLKGEQLFIAQYSHFAYVKRQPHSVWRNLSDDVKSIFTSNNYIQQSYDHRLRIWKGYEIVTFLKRYLDEPSRFNPYLYLGLYPWEIIRDKLIHNKYLFELESHDIDYFDILIMNSTRISNNNQLAQQYLQYNPDCTEFTQGSVHDADHVNLLKNKPNKFKVNRRSLKYLRKKGDPKAWKSLSEAEKLGFTDDLVPDHPNVYVKLYKLDWKTYLTMRYISDNELWQKHMNQLGLYFNGNYLYTYLFFQGNKLEALPRANASALNIGNNDYRIQKTKD